MFCHSDFVKRGVRRSDLMFTRFHQTLTSDCPRNKTFFPLPSQSKIFKTKVVFKTEEPLIWNVFRSF